MDSPTEGKNVQYNECKMTFKNPFILVNCCFRFKNDDNQSLTVPFKFTNFRSQFLLFHGNTVHKVHWTFQSFQSFLLLYPFIILRPSAGWYNKSKCLLHNYDTLKLHRSVDYIKNDIIETLVFLI